MIARTPGDPAASAALMRRTSTATDDRVLLVEARSMEDHLAQQLLMPQACASLLLALGVVTMAIASIGLFGLVSFSVARRTREIGIRVAVGATTRRVVSQVVYQAVGLVAVALLIGLPVAGAVMRPVARGLVGSASSDVFAYVVVSLLLLTVAAVASFVPARHAARVSPSAALRCE